MDSLWPATRFLWPEGTAVMCPGVVFTFAPEDRQQGRLDRKSGKEPSLDARVLFPVPKALPWDSIRYAVWRAQVSLDASLLSRLALDYEPTTPIDWYDLRLARRNRAIAAAYRARAEELEAREIATGLAESPYLGRHPEMLEEFREWPVDEPLLALKLVQGDMETLLSLKTLDREDVALALAEIEDDRVADLVSRSALSDAGKTLLGSHWMLRAQLFRMRAEELRRRQVIAEIDAKRPTTPPLPICEEVASA